MVVEQMHHVQLRHADALADEALAADAFELGHRGPEIGDDRGLRHGRPDGRGSHLHGHRASCHVNYHTPANNRVNVNNHGHSEDPMRFALMLESQQGLSYGDHVVIAKRAEANGIETLFRSDHYTSFPGPGRQPTTDAWPVVAGVARGTDRIGLGVLVSPVTFRHPGSFAKVVTTVDEMSGGRIEVGVGARWDEHEHTPLRAAIPGRQERDDLIEGALAILDSPL